MRFTSFARLFGQRRQGKKGRNRHAAAARLGQRDRYVRPQLENLEDRTVLSVLPTPQVVGSTAIAAGGMNGQLNTAVVAVDPLNPLDVFSVASLHDETFQGNQKSIIVGRYSTDGGATWNSVAFPANLIDPNPVNAGAPRPLLQDAIDPSIAFGYNPARPAEHVVYVVYSENSRDHQYGTIVMSRFNFPSGGIPTPIAPATQQLYTWGFQGGDGAIGYDGVYNPTVVVDNAANMGNYVDPNTGVVQSDPYAGTVYVAFNSNYRPPASGPINPNTILVMAAVPQRNDNLSFSTPKFLNKNGFGSTTERDSFPRLAVSQGTSPDRPSQFATVSAGLVTGIWNDFGDMPGRTITSNNFAQGGVGYYAAGTPGQYAYAIHPMMGNDIPVSTTFNLATLNGFALDPNLGIQDPDTVSGAVGIPSSKGNVTGINVTLDIQDSHMDDVKAELIRPDGFSYLLFNNTNNPGGMQNMNGLPAGPNLGVSAANTSPEAPPVLWDTVFDPLAPRNITNRNDAVVAPFSGHFQAAQSLPTNLPVAQVYGTWQLKITSVMNHAMEMPNFHQVLKWGITFTQHLDTQVTPDSPVIIGLGGMNPPPTDPLVGARYGTLYPTKPAAFPDRGIGPDAVIASDNTVGSFSPYQGRLYVAYTGVGTTGNIVPAQPHTDDTDIFLVCSSDGGLTWGAPFRVNDDSPLDGFSEGNRPQFQPAVAVDQTTGALVVSYRDARYDASRVRTVTTIATSMDGGFSFQNYVAGQGQQPSVNPNQTAGDAITGQNVNVQPLPDNASAANGGRDTLFAWGNYMGLAVAAGHVYPVWAGNGNSGNFRVFAAQVIIADGPRVVGSDMGPIQRASAVQLQDGTTPVPYNSTYAPDGTEMVDGFVVTFDRPMADGRTFTFNNLPYSHGQPTLNPADITIVFHDTVTPQSQLGAIIPVLSVTPLLDTSATAPLQSFLNPFQFPGVTLTSAEQYFGANKFLVRFQPQSRVGTYSYVIGPRPGVVGPTDLIGGPNRSATVPGNPMDQNANAVPDEVGTPTYGGDTYAVPAPANNGPNFLAPYSQLTLPLIVPGPHIITTFVAGSPPSADNLVSSGLTNSVDIVFDRDMDPNSLNATTVLRMVDPNGKLIGPVTIAPDVVPNYPRMINGTLTSAADPDVFHPRTYKITFPAQQTNGTYTLSLAPTIRSEAGDQVDVNQNAGVDILRDVPSGGTRVVGYQNDPGQVQTTTTTITAPITVLDEYVIQGVTVGLNINTQDVRDLSAYLQAPDGTKIPLFTNVGAGGTSFTNFTNTFFSDDATGGPGSLTNPIQNGVAPFTGTYNPQQPLSTLVGKASAGTYLLVITSRTTIRGHNTSLVSWSLGLKRPVPINGLGELVADQSTVTFRLFSLAKSDPVSTKTWTPVGPAGIADVPGGPSTHSGRIAGIAVDPSDPSGNTAYVAGASGGVWKTTNFLTSNPAGPTYVPLTDTAPTFGLNVGGVSVFPRNNDPNQSIIFVLTGEGDTGTSGVGFLRSLDGGASWTLLDSTNNNLSFADPKRDHKFTGSTAFKVVADPTLNPFGQTTLYAAISATDATKAGIWKSTDTGLTWSRMRAGQATDVVLAAGSADVSSGNLRIVYGAFRGEGVFISPDAGADWNLMAGNQGLLWLDARRPPTGYVTVNAGATPNGAKGRITLATPALVPSTAPNARLQNLFYQGWLYALVSNANGTAEDGIYVTKDFGQNWTQIKTNITPARAGVIEPQFPTNNDTDPVLSLIGTPMFPQGNYNQSISVDPSNPNVVYVGGTGDGNPTALIRVDTTGMADARALLAHNNLRNDGGALSDATTGPTILGGGQGGPYGLLDPTFLPLFLLYPQPHWLNLVDDPFNPFLMNSTLQVANLAMNGTVLSESNLGIQVKWTFYDAAIDGSTDLHRVFTMLDPLTGKSRLIFGDDQGIFSVVDPGDGTSNFITGIGTVQGNADPSRNGNIQITQFYGGASQPSQLAANIAGALLYGEAQDDGFPLSDGSLLKNGNITWSGPAGDGQWVGTDQTGSGNVYESRWPCCNGGETGVNVLTDFFRFNRSTSRTFGLFLNAPPDPANWPATFGANAASNPVNGNQLVISSALGNVFRTDSAGFQWFLVGNATTQLDSSYAPALAYGAPDPLDPTGAADNVIWAGTVKGHIFLTLDGGGTWTQLSGGLDGSLVQQIVANPHRGSHEAYAVTAFGVYHITYAVTRDANNRLVVDTSTNPTWTNITGNILQLTHTSLGDSSFVETAAKFLTTIVADWRFAILDNPANPTGPTHPVLYVGGNSGVYRSLDNGRTWTVFPDMADDGAPADGGFLPRNQITHLDLALGDINPQTGLPLSATSPDLLFATTYGRGMFAIRVPAPQAVEEVFVMGLDNRVYGQHLDSRGNPGGPYFQASVDLVQSIITGHDASGRPVVFALGLDSQVYFERFDINGNPVGDFTLAAVGAIRNRPFGSATPYPVGGNKAFTVGTDASGNPELFVVGLDDQVYGLNFDANDSPVGGYFLVGLGAVKALTAGHDVMGRPEVFVQGLDNQIYAHRFDDNGQPLASDGPYYFLTQAGQVLSFGVGQNSSQQPVVFAIGLNNQVYGMNFGDAGLASSGWYQVVAPARVVKSLTVGHDANNNPVVFVTGLDNQVYLAAPNTAALQPAADYALAAVGAVKDFKIGYDVNNIPEVFAIGLDDQVYFELFTAPGTPSRTYRLMNQGRVKSLTVTQ